MARTIAQSIQRPSPLGRIGPRRLYTLPLHEIRPVIRIAHRLPSPIIIDGRIIFDHELVLVYRGRLQVKLGSQRFTCPPHSIVFVPPFVPHAMLSDPDEPSEHVGIHFDFAPDTPPHGMAPYRRKPYEVRLAGATIAPFIELTEGHAVERDMLAVVEARQNGKPWSELQAALTLGRVLVNLFKLSAGAGGAPKGEQRNRARVDRAVAFMQAHFADELTAADLARAAGLSTSHFNRLFQQWTGQSPMDYLRRLRVEKAKQMLADVDLTIKEVALATGFADPYHFSKVFHQVDGLPPTSYREALLASRGSSPDRRGR